MSKFLNIDDISEARGETTFKVARLLTRKECKLYLRFGGGKGPLLCITEQMIDGYYHLFQGKKGDYPMTLMSQHECVQRLSKNNFDVFGLSFMVGKDELKLWSVDGEDRSVYVVAKKSDIDLLPPPSQIEGTSGASNHTIPKRNFFKISPISNFIDEQISSGLIEWQKAWLELWGNIADKKNAKIEDMKFYSFGEKYAYVRRTMKHTSNKLGHAIEYQEDGIPPFKTVSRQSFGRMFRRLLKKSRTPSDSPK